MRGWSNPRIPVSRMLMLLLVVAVVTMGFVRSTAAADYCLFLPMAMTNVPGPPSAGAGPGPDCGPSASEPDLIDFNGDGYADVAIGAPDNNGSPLVQDSGSVTVIYGTADGLSSANAESLYQTGAGGFTQAGEEFGTSLAAADFNGDGYTDLAIGTPGERVDGVFQAGQVNVMYGSSSGLSNVKARAFSQGVDGIIGVAEEEDRFGESLTAGDFNGDGYADLVAGVPLENYEAGGLPNMGAVNVIFGSAAGLTATGNQIIHPALPEVSGTPFWGGRFGLALGSGDFDGDGLDDLAVGIPGYDIATADDVGAVQVFFGSDAGISLLGEQLWRQGFDGVQGAAEEDDWFGYRLAVGDFDQNGIDDLAVGVPYESVLYQGNDFMAAGAVNILYGSSIAGGLTGSGAQIWHRGLTDVFSQPGEFDTFGGALIAADFNGDGADDLAIGVPGDSPNEVAQGSVQVLYSNGSILSGDQQDYWIQDLVGGAGEQFDYFGSALGSSDFNGDGYADLMIGAFGKDFVWDGIDREDAGEATTIYGAANGLTAVGHQTWRQGHNGLDGTPEEDEHFSHTFSR